MFLKLTAKKLLVMSLIQYHFDYARLVKLKKGVYSNC